MTPLEETILQIKRLDSFLSCRFVNPVACPSGMVVIDYRYYRGLEPCPHCGCVFTMGIVTVRHLDGRSVAFHPNLYHYVEAGHPITAEDVDGRLLLAIMADAHDWPCENEDDRARLELEALYLGVLTAKGLKPLSRLEYVVRDDVLNALFEHLDLTVVSVTRVAQNGKRVAHWILGRLSYENPSPFEQYVQEFNGTPLAVGSPSVIRAEARFFGYPDCCAEAYIQDPNFVPDFSSEDLSLLFHRPCRGCKATQRLLPDYRAAFAEARSLYEALRPAAPSA